MTKVKVSSAIGKVLDDYTGSFDITLIDLVKRHCKKELREDEEVLYKMNPIELSLAIVNGHEVELSAKEKVENLYLDTYDAYIENGKHLCFVSENYCKGYVDAIEKLNELLNLELKLEKDL